MPRSGQQIKVPGLLKAKKENKTKYMYIEAGRGKMYKQQRHGCFLGGFLANESAEQQQNNNPNSQLISNVSVQTQVYMFSAS